MDNGLSSLVAGKRRRGGYSNDEDVKENLKASRQWYGGSQPQQQQQVQRGNNNNVMKEGQQQLPNNGHYQGVSVENHIRMQQQQQKQGMTEAGTSMPTVSSLNMEQRVLAAAALQDLRGITESSKAYFQSQLQQQQQHTKYGVQQQQQQQQPLPQLLNSDSATLGGESSSNSQLHQTAPLPLPPLPYIRTPPLHSEADAHNGSPSSSSSGPYPSSVPNLPPCGGGQYGLSQSQQPHRGDATPIPQQQQQLPEIESESSYSSLMRPSQSNLLAQAQNGITQQSEQGGRESALYQRDEFGHGQVVQSFASQGGNVHQLNVHPNPQIQNGVVSLHHGGHTLPANNGFPNGVANAVPNFVSSQNQLPPQGDSQRLGATSLHQQGRFSSMASSSSHHHQQQQGVHSLSPQMGLPNGMVMHQQGRLSSMASSSSHHHQQQQQQQQQGVHSLSPQMGLPNGMVMHQQGVHLRMPEGMVQYQSGHVSQVQQQSGHASSSNEAAAHQQSVQGGCSSGFQQVGFPPLHGDFHQVSNSWYPSIRDSTTISETQPSVSTSRLLLPPSVTDLGSQRGLSTATILPPQLNQAQGGFGDGVLPDQDHLSSSSAGAVPNGQGLDDPALLQRALMRPPPRLTRRSYTKVYKLGSITRAVDVNRFKNYTELRCGLAHMFNLEGQLDQKLGWQLIFTDNEDDLLLVGDDPWEEFVRNVRAIRILTPAEVFYYTNEDKWTAATYNNNSNGGSAPKLL